MQNTKHHTVFKSIAFVIFTIFLSGQTIAQSSNCGAFKNINYACYKPSDLDGDGISDKDDECPEIAGIADFNGCPPPSDRDKDGIIDAKDGCPDDFGLANLNGCPDTDGDGVIDKDDACIRKSGLAKFNGCPDTDGDGIIDKNDKCRDVPGTTANKGCPEIDEETRSVLLEAIKGVQFESGKDIIKTSSYATLNNVYSVMAKHTEYGLQISGHTDSQGRDDANLDLSKRRAAAVRQYLINKGVDESRMKSEGYGETIPVADNGTSAGRAKNRRVEFEIEF